MYSACNNDGDVQSKKSIDFTDKPTLNIDSRSLPRKTKLKLVKLFYKIIPNVKILFRNTCKECRVFIIEVYRYLKENTKFVYSNDFFLLLSQSNCDYSDVDKKFKLIWKFLSFVLYETLTSQVLNSIIKRKLRNTNSNIKLCICSQLHSSNRLFIQCYSSNLKMYGPLEISNSYDIFYLFLKVNNPSPNKMLNSVFTSNLFFNRFNSDNIYKFSSFLNLISFHLISVRDLLKFCRMVVKFVFKITKSLYKLPIKKNEHCNGADINLYLSLIPGLYFYIIDIIKFQNELMQIFPLIWNIYLSKRLNPFVKNLFKLFNISPKHVYQNNLSNPVRKFKTNFKKKIQSKTQLKNGTNKKRNNPVVKVSTGKEKVESIDGINFISFESESDMFEFTKKEIKYFQKTKKNKSNGFNKKSCEGRIIPTKTHDITKIKGWRNKLFITDMKNASKYDKKSFYYKNSKCSLVKNDTTDSNIELKSVKNENKIEENFSNDYYSPKMIEQNRLFLKEFPNLIPNIWDICYKEKYSHILKKINNIYLQSLETDLFLQKIRTTLAAMDNEQGVFQCPLTDEFLDKYADIDVSFDVPQLNKWDDSKLDGALQSLANPKKIAVVDNDFTEQKAGVDLHFGNISDLAMKTGSSLQASKLKKKFILIKGNPVFLDYGNSDKKTEFSSEKTFQQSDNVASSVDLLGSIEENFKSEYTSPKKTLYSKSMYRDVSPINDSSHESCLSSLDIYKSENTDNLVLNFNSCLTDLSAFSFMLPCSAQSNDHSACLNIKSKNMYLGMVVNIGHKRPLNKEVVKNIELLRKDPEIIDECWANIAASAVHQVNSKNTVKRICIPVVSKPLIKLVKFSVENAHKKIDIKTDVKNVVNDVVDYIVRKEKLASFNFSYDPDVKLTSFSEKDKPMLKKYKKSKVERELGRLINVTLVEENKINSTSFGESDCGQEFCSKGCVCHSLNGRTSVFHCGKERCMFKCKCKNKNYSSSSDLFMHHVHKNKLAKEESLWHQTVICKSNDVIIQEETGKSKREKKLPTRFRNNVLLAKDMIRLDLSPQSISNWRNFKPTTNIPKPCSKSIKMTNKKGDQKTSPKLKSNDPHNPLSDSLEEPYDKSNPSNTVKISSHSPIKEPYQKPNLSNAVKKSLNSPIQDLCDKPNPSNTVTDSYNSPIKDQYHKSNSSNKVKNSLHTPIKEPYHKLNSSNTVRNNSNTAIKEPYNKNDSSNSEKKSSNTLKKMPDLLKVSQLSSKSSSVKNKLPKEPLKEVINVKKDTIHKKIESCDNNESNATMDNAIPPDWELEALLEMEVVEGSSDEESDDELHHLSDPFIWCTIHTEYNCQCKNSIYFLKSNVLCQNKSLFNKRISRKQLSKTLCTTYNFSLAHIHDRNTQSARTSGIQFDYHARNNSVGFKNKRILEIKNSILSNTNSIFKLNARKIRNFGKKSDKNNKNEIEVIDVIDAMAKKTSDDTINVVGNDSFFKNIKMNKVSFDLKCLTKKELTNHIDGELSPAVTDFEKEKENESSKTKKKYRIGPAHFEASGSFRTIVTRNRPVSGRVKRSKRSMEHSDTNVNAEENATILNTTNVGLSGDTDVSFTGVVGSSEVNHFYKEVNIEDIMNKTTLPDDFCQFGLLCLTEGFGYLPVKCYTPVKLSVRDPLADDVYHYFKDVKVANNWLNRFFKSKMLFEDLNYNLKWVLIKPYLMNKMKVFDKSLIEYNTKVVNKNGILMDKDIFTADYLRLSMETLPLRYRHQSQTMEMPDSTLKMVVESELVAEALSHQKRKHNPATTSETKVVTWIPTHIGTQHPDMSSCMIDYDNPLMNESVPFKKIKLETSGQRCLSRNLTSSSAKSQIIIEPTDLKDAIPIGGTPNLYVKNQNKSLLKGPTIF